MDNVNAYATRISAMADSNSSFFSGPVGYLSHDVNQSGVIWGPKSIIVVCGYAVFITVTIIGNVIVLVTFALTTNQRTVYNLYYINLSLADLMVGAVAMPLMLMQDLLGRWPLGVVMCDLWVMMDGVFSSASFLTLAAVAWERYCAVAKISLTSVQQSLWRASVIIATTWLLSLAVWVPRQYVQRAKLDWRLVNEKCHDLEIPAHVLACCVILFYIPMLFMVTVYALLYKRLNDHLSKPRYWSVQRKDIPAKSHHGSHTDQTVIVATNDANDDDAHSMMLESVELSSSVLDTSAQAPHRAVNGRAAKKPPPAANSNGAGKPARLATGANPTDHWERRNARIKRATAKTLGCVMTAFLVCWTPYSIVWPLEAFRPQLVSHIVCDVVIWLAYINSAINPFVYVYSNQDLRKACWDVWCTGHWRR